MPSVDSIDRRPSLTSASSFASSELPNTSISADHQNSHRFWRGTLASPSTRSSSRTSLSPKLAKSIFRLVTPHDRTSRRRTPAQPSELAEYGPDDLNARIARAAAERDEEATRIRSRGDPASWGRASRASITSRAALESKHSSIGPLPLFPPRQTRSHGRSSSVGTALASQQQQAPTLEHSIAQYLEEGPHSQTLDPKPQPDPLPSRTPKQRGRLAGLFGLVSKKSVELDKENHTNFGTPGTPTTPSRLAFLSSKLLSTSTNSMRSTNLVLEPAPPLPVTPKDKTKEVSPSPRVHPGRFSLPVQPRRPSLPAACEEHQNAGCQCHGQPAFREVERGWQMTDLPMPTANKGVELQRRKSDGKNGRGRSPGQSIRVPGATPPTHPHPHPYFPCEMPRDRARLEHGMFDFERPGSRPSTPGLDEGLVMAKKEKRRKTRSRSRGQVEEEQDIALAAGEVVGLVAAGAEVRRDRRRRSEDVSKIRSRHVEDDLELHRNLSNPSIARSDVYGGRRTAMGHGLFAFEPPVSPTASQTVLPHVPSSYSRRHEREPAGVMSTVSVRSQGAQVPPPHQPFLSTYVSYPNETTNLDSAGKKGSVRLHGTFSSTQSFAAVPVLSAKFKPVSQHRGHEYNLSQSTAVSGSWNHSNALERHRHVHTHTHSLSGSTVGGPGVGGYPGYPMRSTPTGLGITLVEEAEMPTREERYYDLCENLKLSIGESRYKIFERAIRRYDSETIPLHGPKGLLARVQEVLDDATNAGLPTQTAQRYYRTFVDLVYED